VTAAVEVRDLTRAFHARSAPALAGVSFAIDDGIVFGIVGASGSGKSTLARLIVALDRPTSGTVSVAGKDPFALRAGQLRRLRSRFQLVFQDPLGAADPRWTARQTIAEALALGPPASAGLDRLLDLVQLPAAVLDRRPHALSGGERQRVALGRALMTSPRLLLLDEPLAAVDVARRQEILPYLDRLRRELALPTLYVTHAVEEIAARAEAVVALDEGRVVSFQPQPRLS